MKFGGVIFRLFEDGGGRGGENDLWKLFSTKQLMGRILKSRMNGFLALIIAHRSTKEIGSSIYG
jgi:hypothetical protein